MKLLFFFSNYSFCTDLVNEISSNGMLEGELTGFLDVCKKSLDYQAPRKKKYTRASQALFLTKEIIKEIMTRSRLATNFFVVDLMRIKKQMSNVIVM